MTTPRIKSQHTGDSSRGITGSGSVIAVTMRSSCPLFNGKPVAKLKQPPPTTPSTQPPKPVATARHSGLVALATATPHSPLDSQASTLQSPKNSFTTSNSANESKLEEKKLSNEYKRVSHNSYVHTKTSDDLKLKTITSYYGELRLGLPNGQGNMIKIVYNIPPLFSRHDAHVAQVEIIYGTFKDGELHGIGKKIILNTQGKKLFMLGNIANFYGRNSINYFKPDSPTSFMWKEKRERQYWELKSTQKNSYEALKQHILHFNDLIDTQYGQNLIKFSIEGEFNKGSPQGEIVMNRYFTQKHITYKGELKFIPEKNTYELNGNGEKTTLPPLSRQEAHNELLSSLSIETNDTKATSNNTNNIKEWSIKEKGYFIHSQLQKGAITRRKKSNTENYETIGHYVFVSYKDSKEVFSKELQIFFEEETIELSTIKKLELERNQLELTIQDIDKVPRDSIAEIFSKNSQARKQIKEINLQINKLHIKIHLIQERIKNYCDKKTLEQIGNTENNIILGIREYRPREQGCLLAFGEGLVKNLTENGYTQTINYENGKRNGKSKFYSHKDRYTLTENWKNGLRVGVSTLVYDKDPSSKQEKYHGDGTSKPSEIPSCSIM